MVEFLPLFSWDKNEDYLDRDLSELYWFIFNFFSFVIPMNINGLIFSIGWEIFHKCNDALNIEVDDDWI